MGIASWRDLLSLGSSWSVAALRPFLGEPNTWIYNQDHQICQNITMRG